MIGFFQLAELLHDIIGVRLQVLKDLGLNIAALIYLIHAALHGCSLIVDFVIENFALSIQVRKPQINLLKDVKFTVRLEDCVLQIFDFGFGLFLILSDLVDRVLVFDESVYDRINELLHKVSSF